MGAGAGKNHVDKARHAADVLSAIRSFEMENAVVPLEESDYSPELFKKRVLMAAEDSKRKGKDVSESLEMLTDGDIMELADYFEIHSPRSPRGGGAGGVGGGGGGLGLRFEERSNNLHRQDFVSSPSHSPTNLSPTCPRDENTFLRIVFSFKIKTILNMMELLVKVWKSTPPILMLV